ncbi:glucose-methanol-choline oxidoreductase [Fusarium albosuccineum]|uniref:Glucose-methanol-choline oxidoreductase n=1 Tax=Fusarium albosuccineum TaxID=1237068 RepID=A0A8H4LBS8_9HYPO|nr:glucose-methanol-choline oxidoreductase [Fusarium albosuccineum]
MRQDPEVLAAAQEQYEKYRAGAFTIGGIQSYTFMPTPDSTPGNLLDSHPPNPENEAYYNIVRSIVEKPDTTSAAGFIFLAQVTLHEGGKSFAGTQFLPQNFVSLGCLLSQPFSRGASQISSPNVDAMPDIDPRLLSHPADLDIMAHHVQNLDKLRKTKELPAFLKPDGQRSHPDAHKIGELEGAKKYTRDTATATFHCCGTAAMLPRDKGGVVDTNLIVYGTENLRVVDASIFPLIPRGNILSSVYAVAEKAAHIIKSS